MVAAAVGLWVVALAAIAVALLYDLRRRRPSSKANLPPGPPGIPVLGNLWLLTGPRLPFRVLADLAKQYGPIMFLRLGSTPCVVVSSPEACKEILTTHDRLFADRPKSTGAEHLMYQGKGLIFSSHGTHWRQLRKIATLQLLTQKKIDEFEGLRVSQVSQLVRAVVRRNTVYGAGTAVDLHDMFRALSLNVMSEICCSKRFIDYDFQDPGRGTTGVDTAEGREVSHLIEEVNELLGHQPIGDFIPSLTFLDRFTGLKSRMMKNHRKYDQFLRRVVEEHRNNPKQAAAGCRLDFVDMLLEIQRRDGSATLDDTSVRALCLDIFTAGTHTSASAMEWIMTEVVRHPEVALKLSAEMDAVVGKERLVTQADVPNLPYLQAVVKEGLRFHTVVPLLVPHESVERCTVMGYDIPKSTTVFANLGAVHMDPACWDNPTEFRPDRFLENPDIDVKGQHHHFLPFGTGRRSCPATGLALATMHYALARLVQAFQWSPPQGIHPQDVDIQEATGIALAKAHHLEAVATARLSSLLY